MDPKTLAGLAATTTILIIGAIAGTGLAGGSLAVAACTNPPATAGTASAPTPADGWQPVGTWNAQQVTNAATIITVGQRQGVPVRGWIIAVATAMQESRLTNLPDGDRDSLGLFQQRPSAGWGTPTQILDPTYAATRFYTALTSVPGWQDLPLTVAAQAVQRSAFPDAYATWEPDALTLTETIGPTLTGLPADTFTQWVRVCVALGGDGQPTGTPIPLPPDYSLPADTPPAARVAINWALAQLGTPYSYGGDCTNPHSGNPAHQCDCSSLTQAAYRAGGITIPRTAAKQPHTGTPIPDPNQLQPGDLIFIPGSDGTPTAPGHVGLYIGTDLLIQAPHTGDHIKLTPYATGHPTSVRYAASPRFAPVRD
jgi:cell wall-associated NlpC family hydrolase